MNKGHINMFIYINSLLILIFFVTKLTVLELIFKISLLKKLNKELIILCSSNQLMKMIVYRRIKIKSHH